MKLLAALIVLAVPAVSAAKVQMQPKQAAIADFASCAVAQDSSRARQIMSTAPGSPEEASAMKSLANALNRCTRGRDFVSGMTGEFRGALAEALIAAEPARRERLRGLPEAAPNRAALLPGRAFLQGYARCIATARPQQSLALLATAHGTPEEQMSMMAMGASLSDCMPLGAQYRLNIRDVRNNLASVLYELSEGPRA